MNLAQGIKGLSIELYVADPANFMLIIWHVRIEHLSYIMGKAEKCNGEKHKIRKQESELSHLLASGK